MFGSVFSFIKGNAAWVAVISPPCVYPRAATTVTLVLIMTNALADLLAEGQRCILAGASEVGLHVSAAALDAARATGDGAAELAALTQLGTLARMGSRHAQAQRWLDLAAAGYEAAGDADGQAQVAVQRGQMALDLGDYGEATEWFGQGMQHARRAANDVLASRFLTGIGIASARVGDYPRARDAYEQALALQRARSDEASAANTMHCMAVLELREVEHSAIAEPTPREAAMQRALQLLLESLDLSRRTGRRRLEGMCLNELGHAYRLRGGRTAVVDYCMQAIAIFRELPAPKDECDALLHMARTHLDADDIAAASDSARHALELAKQCGFRPSERDARELLVQCCEVQGRIAEAFAHLKAVREIDLHLREGEVLRRIDRFEHRSALERTAQRQAELEAQARSLDQLATTDGLTGVGNRRALEAAHRELLGAPDASARTCSMLLADLDHFKRINDCFGHATGDEVLRRAARAMAGACRGSDLLARWGGEEFAVLLPDSDRAAAIHIAERLRAAIATTDWSDIASTLQVTASIGVAVGAANESLPSLLRRADKALYAAKHDGRDRVEFAGE